MLTWKLWRALNRPPVRSPVYRRAFRRQQSTEQIDLTRIPLFGWFRNAGLVVLPIFVILIGAPGLVLLSYLALLLAPLLLPFANIVYGVLLTTNVSGSIARERELRTYDVLCTAPEGTLGIHWAYCTSWIHFHVIYRSAMLVILFIGIVASLVGLSPQIIFGVGQVPVGVTLVRGLALGAVFVVDYAQTVIISSLLTLLIPAQIENETNVRLWTASLVLVLQLGVYVPTLLLGIYALPNTLQLLGIDPLLSNLLIPLLLVGFFMALRVTIITGMWRAVQQHLTTTAVELDALTRVAV